MGSDFRIHNAMSIAVSSGALPWPAQWPFLPVMERFGMAVALGVFVGLEREHSGKLGTRTFGLIALLGCLTGIMGAQFIWIAMAFVLLLIWLINWRRLSAHDQLATTTSLSVAIVALCGVLAALGTCIRRCWRQSCARPCWRGSSRSAASPAG
jgi:hypothetical protein